MLHPSLLVRAYLLQNLASKGGREGLISEGGLTELG